MPKVKIFSFLIILIFLLQISVFNLSSCSKNDDWELVNSITITTDGKTKTFKSSVFHSFGEPSEVTKDEYENNRKGKDLDNNDDKGKYKSFSEIEKISNGATEYSYEEPSLNGDWYYYVFLYPDDYRPVYRKKPYLYTNYYLVYVKVVNDTTIKIKTWQGETTYTVTSYTIKDC